MPEEEIEEIERNASFQSFLESTPPGVLTSIADLTISKSELRDHSYVKVWRIKRPELHLFCGSERCNGIRTFFTFHDNSPEVNETDTSIFLEFLCRNCLEKRKTFALICQRDKSGEFTGKALKLGEEPSFGPPVPARVITLIGGDKDLFLRGRRSENQGLGIGAFAYYRRVVENQKNRLISEIKRVSMRLGVSEEVLKTYDAAIAETQFSKAVGDIKAAIPASLLIDGRNPLMLLHSALSEGLHAQTDEDCLELATSVRVILTELSERMGQALKDEKELSEAVKRLSRP